jgi:hypothetical protein
MKTIKYVGLVASVVFGLMFAVSLASPALASSVAGIPTYSCSGTPNTTLTNVGAVKGFYGTIYACKQNSGSTLYPFYISGYTCPSGYTLNTTTLNTCDTTPVAPPTQGACFNTTNTPFDLAGGSQTIMSRGAGTCLSYSGNGWIVYINTPSGQVPLAKPNPPMPFTDTLAEDNSVQSSDYSLSLGLAGNQGSAYTFGALTLTPPFKFDTTDPNQTATYKQQIVDGITKDKTITVQVGPWVVTIPAVVPAVTAPVSPSNLTVATTSDPTKVNLSWQNNSSNYTGVNIERAVSGGPFAQINAIGASTVAYTDTNLTMGTSYQYRVRGALSGSSFTDYSNVAGVTMSNQNCILLSGSGPNKIVFLRGSGWTASDSDYINQVQDIVNNGFKSIDPFKTYANQLAFYADMNKVDQSKLSSTGLSGLYYDTSANNTIINGSSCGTSAIEYIFLFGDPNLTYAWADTDSNTVFMNMNRLSQVSISGVISYTAVHESGHSLGKLDDEYGLGVIGLLPTVVGADVKYTVNGYKMLGDLYSLPRNCTSDPRTDYSYNGYIYGSIASAGCTYAFSPDAQRVYYRPSSGSIMNRVSYGVRKFNVISCGYIVAALDGQLAMKYNAATHWAECENLDTIKDGYGQMVSPPTVNSVNKSAGTNTFNTSGSGFTPSGNSIKLQPIPKVSQSSSSILQASVYSAFETIINFFKKLIPKAHGQTSTGGFYEIDDVSSNGSLLTFSVPTTTPDGVYKISIGALNSAWTDTPYTITVTGNGVGDPTTMIGDIQVTLGTTTTPVTPPTTSGLSLTIPATPVYYCPMQGNASYPLVGTTCSGLPYGLASFPASISGYTCTDNRYVVSGQTCNLINGGVISVTSIPAIAAYYCPLVSGFLYNLNSSNNTCSFGDINRIPAPVLGYTCTNSHYTPSGTSCILNAASSSTILPSTTVYTCPPTPYVPFTSNTCYGGGLGTVMATISHTCPTGYSLSGTACNLIVVPTATYSCPTGSTLNPSNNTCTTTTSTSVPVTYSCPSGSTLSGQSCVTVTGGQTSTIAATATKACPAGYSNFLNLWCYKSGYANTGLVTTYSCPTNYSLSGTSCSITSAVSTTTAPAAATYSCPTGSTLNPSNNTCSAVTSTPAIKTYSCPVGYILNTTDDTCSPPLPPPSISLMANTTNATSTILTWVTNLSGPVIYSLTETSPISKILFTGSTTSFQLSGLNPNTTYCAAVIANNGSQQASSSPTCVTTASLPPTLNIVGNSPWGLQFAWTVAGENIVSYSLVETSPESTVWSSGANGVNQYFKLNLTPNTRYCAALVATYAPGSSATSSETCATTTQNYGGGGGPPPVIITPSPLLIDPGNGGEVPTPRGDGGGIPLPLNYQQSSMANVWTGITDWLSNLFK